MDNVESPRLVLRELIVEIKTISSDKINMRVIIENQYNMADEENVALTFTLPRSGKHSSTFEFLVVYCS